MSTVLRKPSQRANRSVVAAPPACWHVATAPAVPRQRAAHPQPCPCTQTQVSITNSQFVNNGAAAAAEAKALYVEFKGEVSASLSRSTFANNTIGAAQYTACVHNTGNATRKASVSIAGSKGLDPAKPSSNKTAPWCGRLPAPYASHMWGYSWRAFMPWGRMLSRSARQVGGLHTRGQCT